MAGWARPRRLGEAGCWRWAKAPWRSRSCTATSPAARFAALSTQTLVAIPHCRPHISGTDSRSLKLGAALVVLCAGGIDNHGTETHTDRRPGHQPGRHLRRAGDRRGRAGPESPAHHLLAARLDHGAVGERPFHLPSHGLRPSPPSPPPPPFHPLAVSPPACLLPPH